MIGRAVRFIFTFAEKFKREQLDRYCFECEKQFEPAKGLTLWCSRRCAKKSCKKEMINISHSPGRIFHRPWDK